MEEKQKFTEGMMVTIPKNLKHTEKTFTTWPPMKELIGTTQEIKKIRDDGSFKIDGWIWDRRDFEILESPKKTKPIKLEKKQKFTEGMMVTIPENFKYTEAKYGFSEPMKKLIGTVQEIEEILGDGDFKTNKWFWDKKDFKFLEPVIKPIEVSEIKDFKIPEPLKKTKPRKVLLKDLISR